MKENNGMEEILWIRTERKDDTGKVIAVNIYDIYSYVDKEKGKVYALKSTSDRFKGVDFIELYQAGVIEDDKKMKGNFIFSGIVYSNCSINMCNDDEANPIYEKRSKDGVHEIGKHDMQIEDKIIRTSPIEHIEIKEENRAKVQEMIDQGILTLPDSKCIEYKIEPFSTHIKQAA